MTTPQRQLPGFAHLGRTAPLAAISWAFGKTRYVRTPAGVRRYGVPIGSPIPVGRRVKPSAQPGNSGGSGDKPASQDGKPAKRTVRTEAGAKRYGVPIGSPVPLGRKVKKPATPEQPVTPDTPELPDAPEAPAAPERPTAPGTDGRVPLNPAERDVAERRFGSAQDSDGTDRGAVVTDDGDLQVVDADKAANTLDGVINNPDADPEQRDAAQSLRDKIAPPSDAAGPETPTEPEPAPVPASEKPHNKLHRDLVADWIDNGPEATDEELDAVSRYANAGYQNVNDLLRDRLQLAEWEEDSGVKEKIQGDVDRLTELASRYQLPQNVPLYRRTGAAGVPAYPAQPGSVFVEKGFASTSTIPGGASGFNDIYPNLMEIDAPKGMNAVNVDATGFGISGEREMLLPPGTRFRVDSDEMRDGTRWLRVTALPPE